MTATDDLLAYEQALGSTVERNQPSDLADVLERVLDTGIVVAGEIRIDLLDIELLTIKLRLVITSIDKAEEVGLDWWRADPWFSASASRKKFREVVRDSLDSSDASGGQIAGESAERGVRHAVPVVDVADDDRYEIVEHPEERSSS
ncbi:MAG: gas vesicle protein [Ilumatobacter sp.]|nr:gas vesicle protein [Ilumatobacter sp.]